MVDFIEENKKFHFAIAQASKNCVLLDITRKIKDLISLISSLENVPSIIPRSLSWHRKIFEAIKLRNPTKASEYMLEHIREVYKNHVSHVSNSGNKNSRKKCFI